MESKNVIRVKNIDFNNILLDEKSYKSLALPIEEILTFSNVLILIKSVVNEDKIIYF